MDSPEHFECFHFMIKSAHNNAHRSSQVTILQKATAKVQVNEGNLNSKIFDCLLFNVHR